MTPATLLALLCCLLLPYLGDRTEAGQAILRLLHILRWGVIALKWRALRYKHKPAGLTLLASGQLTPPLSAMWEALA